MADRRRRSFLLLAAGLAACVGERAGKNVTEASISAIKEQQAEVEGLAKAGGESFIRGGAEELVTGETSERIDRAAESAMARALDELHRDFARGQGRLSADMKDTASGIAAAAGREVKEQIDAALPDCPGLDRRACLQREARALGREVAAGWLDALLSPRAVLAFGAVAAAMSLAVMLVRAAWSALMRGPRSRGTRRAARAT
jgi:hypothetical protein